MSADPGSSDWMPIVQYMLDGVPLDQLNTAHLRQLRGQQVGDAPFARVVGSDNSSSVASITGNFA
jgi:uncharacterized protein YegL